MNITIRRFVLVNVGSQRNVVYDRTYKLLIAFMNQPISNIYLHNKKTPITFASEKQEND